MAEVTFPGQHTTTTTTTSATTVQTNIRFDPSYVKTIPGYLKIAAIILSLLGFISVECSYYRPTSAANFFNSIAMIGFWFTGIMLAFYLFHIIEKFYKIPWLKLEFGFCCAWALLYLIASIVLTASYHDDAFIAAAFFGFCAMVVYAYDGWLKWRGVQAGELAQGVRVH